MPVKKKPGTSSRRKTVLPPLPTETSKHHPFSHGGEFTHRIFMTLIGILLVYIIFWVGTLIRNNIEAFYYIGQAEKQERTITLEATADVTATPDIAMTTIGMITTGDTVAYAQGRNSEVMNVLIERLKELGIADDDIQTANYNIYPQYNYTSEEGRILEGYEVNQNVTIKIRDLDNANSVIALAGEVGANSVGGLQFTIDDREVYLREARQEALSDVFEKAQTLALTLGVDIVDIVSYHEFDPRGGDLYSSYRGVESLGYGGAPDIEAGSMDVEMNVSVTFEIR